jgi:nucleotide-binding universal stress UspA family protein
MIRPHVRELASRFQATVILIAVVEPMTYADGMGETFPVISEEAVKAKIDQAQKYLDGVAAKLRDKGIACKKLVSRGPVVESIIRAAEAEEADLIAMTSHGHGGLTRLFYGSVAAGILNRVETPLFIVRSRWSGLGKKQLAGNV